MTDSRKTVLILGGGAMQLPAIRLAAGMGWKVIVADGSPAAPGAAEADVFEHVDLSDSDGMLAMARRYRIASDLDGVFTAGTDFSATVAYVAQELGLPGIPYETALDASDKFRMRSVFARHGIPSPRFVGLSMGDDVVSSARGLEPPYVVKPVDNMGARGIRRVDDPDGLREAAEQAFSFSRSGRVIVEEFIDGPEFSLDALVFRGKVTLCGIADRLIVFPPYFVEMGHTMPTEIDGRAEREIIDVFFRGIKALGIDNGAAKGDVKYSSRGPVIGEIAARLSGGYMSGWTYPLASGVEVTRGGLRVAVGMDPGDLSPVHRMVSAERAYISIPGKVVSVHGEVEARKVPMVEHLFPRCAPGSVMVFPTNNVQKAGNVISLAPTRGEAIKAAEDGARDVFIRLENSDPATWSFLFGGSEAWAPDAYTLAAGVNVSALASMPRDSARRAGEPPFIPLPDPGAEPSADWMGRSFTEGLDMVRRYTGNLRSGRRLGTPFWRAFLRGGVQGGVWVLETAAEMERAGGAPGRIGERYR